MSKSVTLSISDLCIQVRILKGILLHTDATTRTHTHFKGCSHLLILYSWTEWTLSHVVVLVETQMKSSSTSRSPVWLHQKTALLTESFQLDTESLRNPVISAQLLIESTSSTNSCHFWQPQQKGQTPKSAWGLNGSFSPEVAPQWAMHYPGRVETGKTSMVTLWITPVPGLRGGHFSSRSVGSLFIEKAKYREKWPEEPLATLIACIRTRQILK